MTDQPTEIKPPYSWPLPGMDEEQTTEHVTQVALRLNTAHQAHLSVAEKASAQTYAECARSDGSLGTYGMYRFRELLVSLSGHPDPHDEIYQWGPMFMILIARQQEAEKENTNAPLKCHRCMLTVSPDDARYDSEGEVVRHYWCRQMDRDEAARLDDPRMR